MKIKDRRRPRAQIGELSHGAGEQEKHRPQAENGENVRREDDEGIVGDGEDGGDGVGGKDEVGDLDRDEHDEERRDAVAARVTQEEAGLRIARWCSDRSS